MMKEMQFGGTVEDRSVLLSMWRGLRNRCPHCGRGRIFAASLLSSEERCAECGEEFFHHRADDLPAYLVILIVGHVVVAAFVSAEKLYALSTFQHLAIWAPVTVIASIALLRPVKGAVIGLQWALRMHGFSGEDDMLESRGDS